MKQLARAGAQRTGFRARPALADSNKERLLSDQYHSLLYKIASCFGFSDGEAGQLVQATLAYTYSHPAERASLPQRVWLAKVLVRQCVFCISSELFRQMGNSSDKQYSGCLDDYYYRTIGMQHLHQMPLSYRVVYILSHFIGFLATEIATIVNAPLFTVKERYYKAQAFLLARP